MRPGAGAPISDPSRNRTDDLTGLGNRRLGNQLLDQLNTGDSVLILDLDHFKHVHDTHGHARGDLLRQELGAFLRAEVRDAARLVLAGIVSALG